VTGKKILIADDEEDLRRVVELYLQSLGYEVFTAFDGLDAISMAQTEKPDLIVLDVMMPVLDGFEVARKLKAEAETREIPIVMLSAAGQKDSVQRGIEAGAREYMVKPFEPHKLAQVIGNILK
jgi:two-component system, OmpR family, alkaline phosphatase synthesis response regulator PhoP